LDFGYVADSEHNLRYFVTVFTDIHMNIGLFNS